MNRKKLWLLMMMVLGFLSCGVCQTKTNAGSSDALNLIESFGRAKESGVEFKEVIDKYSMRLVEEKITKRISYKKRKNGMARTRLTRIYSSADESVVIEFESRAITADEELSHQEMLRKMEVTLVCRRVVWGKLGSEQQMPYGLQIGKDDVKTAIEKVGEKVVVEEFDGNRSGYVNFYFPFDGVPYKLHFDFGLLSKVERFY